MTRLFIILLICWGTSLWGQNGQPLPAGARGAGMGNVSVGFQDINSIFGNQAGLAGLEQTAFTVIGEQRFMGFGIRSVGAGIGIPVSAGTFGVVAQYFGIEEYNEQKAGLSYSRKLFDKLSIGVQFNYLNVRVEDFGNTSLFTFEGGLQSQVSRNLLLGFYTYSPVRVNITEEESLPTIFKLGGSLKVSKKLTLAAEVEKDIDFPAAFHLGIEYAIVKALLLRVGVETNPAELSIGFGYRLEDKLRIDIAASYHQFLGITPTFGMSYLLKKN